MLFVSLRMLPVPKRAGVEDVLAEQLQQRLHVLDCLLVAADKDGQRAFLGADLHAGQRRIDHRHSLRALDAGDASHGAGQVGREVDMGHTVTGALEDAMHAEDGLVDLRRPRQRGEDDVGVLRRGCRTVAPACAQLDQVGGRLLALVVNGDVVARLDQMPGDRVAHVTGADESNAHAWCPFRSSASITRAVELSSADTKRALWRSQRTPDPERRKLVLSGTMCP